MLSSFSMSSESSSFEIVNDKYVHVIAQIIQIYKLWKQNKRQKKVKSTHYNQLNIHDMNFKKVKRP